MGFAAVLVVVASPIPTPFARVQNAEGGGRLLATSDVNAATRFSGALVRTAIQGELMKRVAIGMLIIVAMIGTCLYFNRSTARAAADGPAFTSDGKLILPTGYRKWVFIGAPLTPNGLNDGKAGFPEYHHVYVQEKNLEAYQRDGVFPEGTVIVKELALLRKSDYPDGSSDSASGRGFGAAVFNGLDVTVKDSKRYEKTNGWGFFNFGHHALPYEATSKEAAETECASCHKAGAAKTDMTWVGFYPVLRGNN